VALEATFVALGVLDGEDDRGIVPEVAGLDAATVGPEQDLVVLHDDPYDRDLW